MRINLTRANGSGFFFFASQRKNSELAVKIMKRLCLYRASLFRRLTAGALLLALSAVLGCAPAQAPKPQAPAQSTAPVAQNAAEEDAAKADDAWLSGRYAQSELLYAKLLAGPGLSQELRLTALKRLALSALFSGHYQKALTGLNDWASADPTVLNTWEWQYRYVQALSRTGMEQKAQEHLARILAERKAPWPLQAEAAIELFKRYASSQSAARGAQILADVHKTGPDDASKAKMEEYLAKNLGDLPDMALANCVSLVNDQNRVFFPYDLIAFEQARRAALTAPEHRAALRELADILALNGDLADKELFNRILNKGLADLSGSSIEALTAQMGPAGTAGGVAVILPLGGQFREFGGKILKGIRAGQTVLAKNGVNLDVVFIDSTQPGWMDNVANLPANINLIGGPLHKVSFLQIQAAGLLNNRVFLSFLPTLGEAQEGMEAWRFFSSQDDEVKSLLKLTLSDYGIKNYAILRPEDRYGQTMGELFALETSRLGGQVTATSLYGAADATGWDQAVKNLIQTNGQAAFGAVFIPDEWNRADGILPYFFYNNVKDLLILGPQLWTEAMTRAAAQNLKINIQNYRLAICPGAWWADNPSQAARDLIETMKADNLEPPDFWVALGYDFARFAARLTPMPMGVNPGEINAKLAQTAASMDWSMAPLSYDESGKASQDMFLFRPSVAGPVRLDPEGFRERLTAIRKQEIPGGAPESEQSYAPLSTDGPLPGPEGTAPDGQPIPAQPVPAQPAPVQPQSAPVQSQPGIIMLDGPAANPQSQPAQAQPVVIQ